MLFRMSICRKQSQLHNYKIRLYGLLTLLLLLTVQNSAMGSKTAGAPLTVPGAITITTATAEMLHKKGYPFVDVRNLKHFNHAHIPGAHHLPVKGQKFNTDNLRAIAKKNQLVVFYCNGINCMGSSIASKKAVTWGWTQVAYYRAGIPEWLEQGLPVESVE